MVMVYYNTQTLFIAKLKHSHNGGVIIIKGKPFQNVFTQISDGRVVVDNKPIL